MNTVSSLTVPHANYIIGFMPQFRGNSRTERPKQPDVGDIFFNEDLIFSSF